MAKRNKTKKKQKFPQTLEQIVKDETQTTNYEGGIAFNLSPKARLYQLVATCLVGEPKFYEEGKVNEQGEVVPLKNQDSLLLTTARELLKTEPEYVLKLAAYARNALYLRTIPQVLLAEASLVSESKPFVRKWTPFIVKRPDELTESVAYLAHKFGGLGDQGNKKRYAKGSLPACLKKGLADAFHNFDQEGFSKYKLKNSGVSLQDVIRLVHPVPKVKGEKLAFANVAHDTLPEAETWETFISANGSTTENWTSVVPKLGYMAALRNLRNLLEKEIPNKVLDQVLAKLTDPDEVGRSKQWPYRFLSAYCEIEKVPKNRNVPRAMLAISQALDVSVKNLPDLDGSTAVFADNSGSMSDLHQSGRSKMTKERIANLMMAIANRVTENSITGIFGTTFAVKKFDRRERLIDNMLTIVNDEVGSSTNAYLSVDYLTNHNIKVDRIIIFSDEECYDTSGYGYSLSSSLKKYKKEVNPKVRTYMVNLEGYGTSEFSEKDPTVFHMAGFTEKLLALIPAVEKDPKTITDVVEHYVPPRAKLKRSVHKEKKDDNE